MTNINLNHIAIVVADMDAALRFWRDSLGLAQAGAVESVPAEAVDVATLRLSQSHIELIQPTTADSGVAKYQATRGPGLHHLCLEVPDLDAKLGELQAKRLRAHQRDAAPARQPSLRLHPPRQHRRRPA